MPGILPPNQEEKKKEGEERKRKAAHLLLSTSSIESNGAISLLSERNALIVVVPRNLARLTGGTRRRGNGSGNLRSKRR